MLDLWAELQRVRRQFNDLKTQTKEDLEKQRKDFDSILRSIQGLTRNLPAGDGGIHASFYGGGGGDGGGGTNYDINSVIHEVIRRTYNRGVPSAYVPDPELLNKLRNGVSSSSDNTELYNELLKK